jgi:hypothetical protein
MHWLYEMVGDSRDPTNNGRTKTWFEYYKVNNGYTSVTLDTNDAIPGDVLWFVMDGKVLGRVFVDKVSYNIVMDGYEAYYDSNSIIKEGAPPKDARRA